MHEYRQSQMLEFEEEHKLTFLVATDNHCGFKEKHPERGEDSFDALREVMEEARDRAVDFVILGGDLFHESVPSMKSIHRTCEIFKQTVLGEKEINFELSWKDGVPNFINKDINIAIPVFVVHGNHDCPVPDFENRSAQDLIEVNSYVNTFGQQQHKDRIVVYPIVFQKGRTQICLYGLGHMKDKNLVNHFKQNQVEWDLPPNHENSFNILVIHQNRFKGKGMGNRKQPERENSREG